MFSFYFSCYGFFAILTAQTDATNAARMIHPVMTNGSMVELVFFILYNIFMENGKNWKLLKDYRCPLPGCGASLQQFNNPNFTQNSIHKCTECEFQITDHRLCAITVVRHRKLEPPDFIQELRNQEDLNNL